jgi:hypothetical protein
MHVARKPGQSSGSLAAGDEVLLPFVLRQQRGLRGFLVVLLLLHLQLRDEEGATGAPMLLPHWFTDGDAVAAAPPNGGWCRVLHSSFTSHFGTLYGVLRCEEGIDRVGPEEEEFEDDRPPWLPVRCGQRRWWR